MLASRNQAISRYWDFPMQSRSDLARPRLSASRLAEQRKSYARSRVSNGTDILPGITDGRSLIVRRYRDIAGALLSDAGGVDNCSEAKQQLIRRFAACSVLAEQQESKLANGEQIDVTQHALLCSTLTRLASRLGLERRAKTIVPTLDQYLQQQREAAE